KALISRGGPGPRAPAKGAHGGRSVRLAPRLGVSGRAGYRRSFSFFELCAKTPASPGSLTLQRWGRVNMGDKALQNQAEKIIRPLIPSDAEQRVSRAWKQWNQIIRDHIRSETGLKLSEGDTRYSIPVQVVDGLPLTLAKLIEKCHDPVV